MSYFAVSLVLVIKRKKKKENHPFFGCISVDPIETIFINYTKVNIFKVIVVKMIILNKRLIIVVKIYELIHPAKRDCLFFCFGFFA